MVDDKLHYEKISQERIEECRMFLAKTISGLEQHIQNIKWACESQKWNDDVAYILEDGALKLSYALAAFDLWNTEEDNTTN